MLARVSLVPAGALAGPPEPSPAQELPPSLLLLDSLLGEFVVTRAGLGLGNYQRLQSKVELLLVVLLGGELGLGDLGAPQILHELRRHPRLLQKLLLSIP